MHTDEDRWQALALVSLCLILAGALLFLVVQIVRLAPALGAAPLGVSHTVVPAGEETHQALSPLDLGATPILTQASMPPSPEPQEPTDDASPSPQTHNTVTTPPPPVTSTPLPASTPVPLGPWGHLPSARPTAMPVDLEATPVLSSSYPIPTPVPRLIIPEQAITIILLGSDRRPDWQHWNTDAIQYVIIYPETSSATVVSIPRDLYVYLPGLGMRRINTADMYGELYGFDGGGFGYLNQTLLYNLGITADYYAKVNFQGLKALVDALGGIDMPVHCRLEDYWPYPDEQGEYHKIALDPGIHHMDGKLALWYARSRKTTSVFDREARQQQVLEAMWWKAREEGVLNMLPALYQQYGDLVETNLGWGTMLKLGILAARLEPSRVRMVNIGREQVIPYVTDFGGYVFLPVWEEIDPILERALLPPAPSRLQRGFVRIEIVNGSSHPQWELLAADRLWDLGFTPVVGGSDGQRYEYTMIQVLADYAKGTGLSAVQEAFGLDESRVVYVGDDGSGFKLRLILGQDYQPCPRAP